MEMVSTTKKEVHGRSFVQQGFSASDTALRD
ncbi:MAG: hypothetical protein XD93_0705, partial [candidate division WS6 bacterium 34_10]